MNSDLPCRFRLLSLLLVAAGILLSAPEALPQQPALRIPRVSNAPRIEDFLTGRPREAEACVADFRQYEPGDGDPASRETKACLSFDERNLYVVFVCKDDPAQIRARLAKREDIDSDDGVTVGLDTFHDHHRAYSFSANPLGVQQDSIYTEGQESDTSFDTLWHCEGRITEDGYVVWFALPFKSLRFPRAPVQNWGIVLGRAIRRNNETSHWPYVTQKTAGIVQQYATLEGLSDISPGRNMQFIPYAAASRARYLDTGNGAPAFRSDTEGRVGLDAKLVFRDALTLDLTLNPDFSQVESDEPQVTVNQRYEVFFPEKRPFFIENAGFFQTPVNLFFSRRIVDPQFGARMTGKVGRWSLGVIGIDDRVPGAFAPPPDSFGGERAGIGIVRVQREFGNQSSVGFLMTGRSSGSESNRVYSLDTRLKLNPNWVFTGQMIKSDTRLADGTRLTGPAYWAELSNSGRHFKYAARYSDRSPSFRADLGFIQRVDIRQMEHAAGYYWKPKGGLVTLFGPDLSTIVNWDRLGRVQDWIVDASFGADLKGPAGLGCRRVDAFELFQGIGFRKHSSDCGIVWKRLKWLELTLDYLWGVGVNYFPGPGLAPFLGSEKKVLSGFTYRPSPRLRIDETYIYSLLTTRGGPAGPARPAASIFNNHILRSKVNYQFTRPLSVRAILDYNSVLADPALVALDRAKTLKADILLTYLLNPGTALYLGYTDGYENLDVIGGEPPTLRRTSTPTTSTGRQFFIKLSYLWRY